MTHQAYSFETEFGPDGAILSGPQRTYVSREEVAQATALARSEGEAKAKSAAEARVAATLERIDSQLSPARDQIAEIADALRREAAELAMIAARKIAGDALDEKGAAQAAKGVEEAVRMLKGSPVIHVFAETAALPEIERRIEQLRRQQSSLSVAFIADDRARPGDWRVEWADGVMEFRREDIENAISAAMQDRLAEPVESQLDLFNAA